MINLFRFRTLKPVLNFVNNSSLRYRHKQPHGPKENPCTGKPKPLMELNCKVALITGGAEGIGFAIAHELLSEKIKNVALIGTDNCKGREAVSVLNCAYGKNKAVFINCDVQSKVQVNECYVKAMKEFGKLDIIVNAAGVFDGCNWEKEIMTNLVGTIHNVVQAYKIMNKKGTDSGGVILNISGLYGIKPLYAAPTLSAAYYGIVGLSRSFGDNMNFQKTGIRVVTLCPGITNTNFIKNAEKRTLTPEMGKQLETLLCKIKRQNADVCGKSAIHVLKHGTSGSVWVVAGSKLYSLNFPKWKKYRVLESQLI